MNTNLKPKYIIVCAILALVAAFMVSGNPATASAPAIELKTETSVVDAPVAETQPEVVETAPQTEIVTNPNPNNCNLATQWMWEDYTCHDKEVVAPEATVTAISVHAPVVGCEHYRDILSQYSWDVETMMYAMQKESSCNPHAVGDDRVIGGVYAPSCGLLQIRTLPGRPSCDELKDPVTNVSWAYKVFSSQGYGAWSVLR